MIWVLVVLAALPLVMGALMIFILRSGALHRMRRARAEDGVDS